MDYLDKAKQLRQNLLLWVGYILIATAIVVATLILVYQAYGFNLGKNGTVIQNGLVFLSSEPNPASIYLNGTLNPNTTNTRLILPSGAYKVLLTRTGYRAWSRNIVVNGGAVEHFDYPFLFPSNLTTKSIASYVSAPGLVTQSPDRRWLLVEKPGSYTDFDLYDFKDPAKPVVTTISLPSGVISAATTSQSWKLVSWADDNQHILLNHLFDGKSEYILLDRANISQSVNLTNTLGLTGGTLALNNLKYNLYEYLDASGNLKLYNQGNTNYQLIAPHVLNYKSYGSNVFLYVTDSGAPKGKVYLKMNDAGINYDIKTLPVSTNYLLSLTTYSGTLYVAAGASSDNQIYIYSNPVGQIAATPNQLVVPIWILHVNNPNYLSFSNSAQFIIAEKGVNVAVYDIQNNVGFKYSLTNLPIDSPQPNVSWMDGDRLIFVSGGKLVVQDYDNLNRQTLISANPNYIPAFSSNYFYMYSFSETSQGIFSLDETPLLTPTDL